MRRLKPHYRMKHWCAAGAFLLECENHALGWLGWPKNSLRGYGSWFSMQFGADVNGWIGELFLGYILNRKTGFR